MKFAGWRRTAQWICQRWPVRKMSLSQVQNRRSGYLLAVGSVSLALLITSLAWPLLEHTPFFLLFAATMVSAQWGGERAGLLSIPLAAIGQILVMGDSFPPAFALRGVPVFVVLAFFVNRLITSRHRIEAALRASEAQFRAGWEHAAIGVALVNPQGRIIRINPALERILGCAEQDCVDAPFLRFTHPGDVQIEEALFAALAEGREHEYRREQRYRRDDGTVIWGRVVVSAIRANDRQRAGALLMLEDITDRKALEEQVRRIQKLDAMGQLVAGVAHDFNNFLTAIGGYTELALREIEDTPAVQNDLREVLSVSHRAAALTRQLLAFSRPPALDSHPVNLDEVIPAVQSLLQQLLGENIHVVTALRSGAAGVKLDPSHLEQIVVNLAVNARDAMPSGGTLMIETSRVDLDHAYAADKPAHPPAGSYVLLTVSDTGCGMDDHVKAHVFEPFFTTKTAAKGTGLGLATVYGIVKQCNGYIWVYSEPGRGTSFKLYFPHLAQGLQTGDSRPYSPNRPADATARTTVLVVEDDPSVRTLTCAILRKEGYEVLDADSGEQALTVIIEHRGPVHLIVADLTMLGMGGAETARQVRSRYPEARVLHISGFSELALNSQRTFDAETAFLAKPFSSQQLLSKVQELLQAQLEGSASRTSS